MSNIARVGDIATGSYTANYATNDLAILDIPAELNYMVTSNIGVRPYAEYAYNTNAGDRQAAALARPERQAQLCQR